VNGIPKLVAAEKRIKKKQVLFLNPTFEPNAFFSQFSDLAKSGDHHP